MMCYKLEKEKRVCLGKCQFKGRIGKLLYLRPLPTIKYDYGMGQNTNFKPYIIK